MQTRAVLFVHMQTDGKKLKRLREHAGLSLRALSAASGVAFSSISALERGGSEGRPATVKALADALGVTVADLVLEEEAVA